MRCGGFRRWKLRCGRPRVQWGNDNRTRSNERTHVWTPRPRRKPARAADARLDDHGHADQLVECRHHRLHLDLRQRASGQKTRVKPGGPAPDRRPGQAPRVGRLGPGRPDRHRPPAKVGRPVALQVKKGSKWKTVKKTKLNKKGRAEFGAPISKGGQALTYRATATPFKGSKAGKSKSVSTSRWLTPTWTDEFSGSSLDPVWNHRGGNYEPGSLRACSKGDPRAVSVGGGTARLSVIKDPSRSEQVRGQEGRQVHRQVRLPPQRPHRHAGRLLVQVRLRCRPHQVPEEPRPARRVLDAARRRGQGCHRPAPDRCRDRRHRVLRRQAPRGWPHVLHLLEEQEGPGRQDRLVDQGLPLVPREQARRLVQELPRVLGGVDPQGLHLPHRRQGDLPHQGRRLRPAAVPDPEHARLRLRDLQDRSTTASSPSR